MTIGDMRNNVISDKLVKEAQEGNKNSLDQIATLAQMKLYAYFCRLTLDSDISQELTQETLCEMVRSLKKLKKPKSFWPWLWWLAYSKAQLFFKKRQKNKNISMSSFEKDSLLQQVSNKDYNDGLSVMIRKELSETVLKALEKLNYRHRNILILRCFEEMPYSEIAKQMDCKEIQVRALFFRAKKSLKKQLSRDGYGKNMLLPALGLFANLTSQSDASTGFSVSAASLKVGFSGVFLGTLTTKPILVSSSVIIVSAFLITDFMASDRNLIVNQNASRPTSTDVSSTANCDNKLPDIIEKKIIHPVTKRPEKTQIETAQILFVDHRDINKKTATIQDAIDNAKSGDVIVIEDGLYIGHGNYNIDFRGKAVTLKSSSGPENCIIDCQNLGRGFSFQTSEDSDSILEGFTIINGYADNGGGIYCYDSGPTIINCFIKNNNATNNGGGIYGGNGLLENCIISNNLANNKGGGLYGNNGSINDCIITGNTASYYGGGLFDCDGDIFNCEISRNKVTVFTGGGLHNCDGRISNCLISENMAGHKGGGLFCCNGTITNCIISHNSTGHRLGSGGGGLYGCQGTIINCTIVGNLAVYEGNEICSCGNKGNNQGGGIYNIVRSPIINNCIIWGNEPDQINNSSNCKPPNITYSNIQGGHYGKGNIDQPPLFTFPEKPLYHLKKDSPCVDAGDPNYVLESTELDIDMMTRVFGSRIDIGSDEYSKWK
jgi:RNA polymerase sigma factor (sigma-70 family)